MNQNGKGDRNRSDPVKYAKGYDRIFGKQKGPKSVRQVQAESRQAASRFEEDGRCHK